MKKGKTPAEIQASILSTYYTQLAATGYMDDIRTSQLLTAVLLLDTIYFFADYIDNSYIDKVEKFLRKSNCCNCAIKYNIITTEKCADCEE